MAYYRVTAHFIPFLSGLAAFANKVIFRRGAGGSAPLFSMSKKSIEKQISLSIMTIILLILGPSTQFDEQPNFHDVRLIL